MGILCIVKLVLLEEEALPVSFHETHVYRRLRHWSIHAELLAGICRSKTIDIGSRLHCLLLAILGHVPCARNSLDSFTLSVERALLSDRLHRVLDVHMLAIKTFTYLTPDLSYREVLDWHVMSGDIRCAAIFTVSEMADPLSVRLGQVLEATSFDGRRRSLHNGQIFHTDRALRVLTAQIDEHLAG